MAQSQKINEIQELITQVALLNERFLMLEKAVERWGDDHEKRIRALEDSRRVYLDEINGIKTRITNFNLIQAALTAAAASLVAFLGRK